ncbi:hypothetical protein ABPG74_021643 [Tetrahymena malaccensis]
MDIESLNINTSQKIQALQKNQIKIRQFLWQQKNNSRADNIVAYKKYLFVLTKFYEGDRVELLQNEFKRKDNGLFNLQSFLKCENFEFSYFGESFNLVQLIFLELVNDCILKREQTLIFQERIDCNVLIMSFILLNQSSSLTHNDLIQLKNIKSPFSFFMGVICSNLEKFKNEYALFFDQDSMNILYNLVIDNVETLLLINAIAQKKIEMLEGHLDSLKIQMVKTIQQKIGEEFLQQYVQDNQLIQINKNMITKIEQRQDQFYALLLAQSDDLDIESIRVCARYNIQDIDVCINKFLKNNLSKISQNQIQQIVLDDMKQNNFQEGVYMIYLSLKMQEVKQDIIFLYQLPLSYYFDYLLNHPHQFKFIHKEFIVLVTQFAPILCQTHLTFKKNSILKGLQIDEQILNMYSDMMNFSQSEFKKIIENKKLWFQLFGISMAQVSGMTLKWFVNESIGQRNIKLSGCSDPMHFLLIKKKYFQNQDHLEQLLCCIEVMIKSWEIYTDAYRISSKEKQINYSFQLNIQITQFLIECLSRESEQPTKCDLLICDFVNQYGLSNGSIIDYIIQNGFCEENIWKTVQNIQWLQIGLGRFQKLLEESPNQTFNLKFLTCLVCKYKSLQSCKIAESILDLLSNKVSIEIDGKCVLAYIECLNSLKKSYPELRNKTDQCQIQLKNKYQSPALSQFALRPYQYVI